LPVLVAGATVCGRMIFMEFVARDAGYE
jgi:hypothetical protein